MSKEMENKAMEQEVPAEEMSMEEISELATKKESKLAKFNPFKKKADKENIPEDAEESKEKKPSKVKSVLKGVGIAVGGAVVGAGAVILCALNSKDTEASQDCDFVDVDTIESIPDDSESNE